MTDREFLIWIHQRLALVHNENESFDYMSKFRCIIANTPHDKTTIHNGNGKGSMEELIHSFNIEQSKLKYSVKE